jgi:hypothetical protein
LTGRQNAIVPSPRGYLPVIQYALNATATTTGWNKCGAYRYGYRGIYHRLFFPSPKKQSHIVVCRLRYLDRNNIPRVRQYSEGGVIDQPLQLLVLTGLANAIIVTLDRGLSPGTQYALNATATTVLVEQVRCTDKPDTRGLYTLDSLLFSGRRKKK